VPYAGSPRRVSGIPWTRIPQRSSATQASSLDHRAPRPPTKKRHVGRSTAKTWHHRTPTATGCSEVHWTRVLRPRVAVKAGMTSNGRIPNGYLRRKAALRHLNRRRFTQSRRPTMGPVKGVLYCAPRAVRRPVQRMHSGQRFSPRGGRNPLPYPALTGGRAGSDWGKRTGFGTPTTSCFPNSTRRKSHSKFDRPLPYQVKRERQRWPSRRLPRRQLPRRWRGEVRLTVLWPCVRIRTAEAAARRCRALGLPRRASSGTLAHRTSAPPPPSATATVPKATPPSTMFAVCMRAPPSVTSPHCGWADTYHGGLHTLRPTLT
jgi:hypothetical protein